MVFKKGHKFYKGGEKGWFTKGHTPYSKGKSKFKKPKIMPLCACRCGERLVWQKHHGYLGIPKYILGHNKQISWNKGLTKEISESIKRQSEKMRGSIPWNKKYKNGEERKIGKLESKKRWMKKNPEKIKEHDEKKKEKLKSEENKKRKQLGLPLVGEGFKHEMELLVYIHHLFGNYEILTHHRKTLGDWGYQGLELDIYIPELKLAFEYNGIQHYEFKEFFHKTEEEFEAQQYRDRCKKKICKLKGITLIRIRYDEKLSEQLILSKLKYIPIKINQEILYQSLKYIKLNKK